jgi:hypothetical protein
MSVLFIPLAFVFWVVGVLVSLSMVACVKAAGAVNITDRQSKLLKIYYFMGPILGSLSILTLVLVPLMGLAGSGLTYFGRSKATKAAGCGLMYGFIVSLIVIVLTVNYHTWSHHAIKKGPTASTR